MQHISLRGHNEYNSSNNGVFQDLVDYTARHNAQFKSKLESMPKNANYLSPEIQNEVLDVLAMSVIEQIRDSCTNAVFYTIGADETKDISKKELLTVTIRFYSEEHKSVVERFVGLKELHGLDAETITQTIVDKVEKELNLSLDNCLSVTFDGAST